MYPLPSMPMPAQHDVPRAPEWLWHDDDDALDAWLASLSVGAFDRILSYLMDDPAGVAAVLDSTA